MVLEALDRCKQHGKCAWRARRFVVSPFLTCTLAYFFLMSGGGSWLAADRTEGGYR